MLQPLVIFSLTINLRDKVSIDGPSATIHFEYMHIYLTCHPAEFTDATRHKIMLVSQLCRLGR